MVRDGVFEQGFVSECQRDLQYCA